MSHLLCFFVATAYEITAFLCTAYHRVANTPDYCIPKGGGGFNSKNSKRLNLVKRIVSTIDA